MNKVLESNIHVFPFKVKSTVLKTFLEHKRHEWRGCVTQNIKIQVLYFTFMRCTHALGQYCNALPH